MKPDESWRPVIPEHMLNKASNNLEIETNNVVEEKYQENESQNQQIELNRFNSEVEV